MKPPNDDLQHWPDAAGPNSRPSVFAHDLVVEGDVTSSGPIEIQGKVVGLVRAPNVGIADSGRVEGSVVASDLSVLGMVSGEISARNVQLAVSARVHANVLHDRIAIEAGAELEGRLHRKT